MDKENFLSIATKYEKEYRDMILKQHDKNKNEFIKLSKYFQEII